jgi:putative alpha-1,2-mannosidase
MQDVELRVGISFIDVAHAKDNFNTQINATSTFVDIQAATYSQWNALLSRVSVDPATPQNDTVRFRCSNRR